MLASDNSAWDNPLMKVFKHMLGEEILNLPAISALNLNNLGTASQSQHSSAVFRLDVYVWLNDRCDSVFVCVDCPHLCTAKIALTREKLI